MCKVESGCLDKRKERFLRILAHTKSEIRARNTEEDLEVVDPDQLFLIFLDSQGRYNLSLSVFNSAAVSENTCMHA